VLEVHHQGEFSGDGAIKLVFHQIANGKKGPVRKSGRVNNVRRGGKEGGGLQGVQGGGQLGGDRAGQEVVAEVPRWPFHQKYASTPEAEHYLLNNTMKGKGRREEERGLQEPEIPHLGKLVRNRPIQLATGEIPGLIILFIDFAKLGGLGFEAEKGVFFLYAQLIVK
jgi:hypothetical protein